MQKNAVRRIFVIPFLLISYILSTLLVYKILEAYSFSGRAILFVSICSLMLLLPIYKIRLDLEKVQNINQQLSQANSELESLRDISELLNSTLELPIILNRSIEIIEEMLPFEGCSIWTYDSKKCLLSLAAAQIPEDIALPETMPGGMGLAQRAFRQGGPLFIKDSEEELADEQLRFCQKAGIRSIMAYPIFHGPLPLGLILMGSRQPNQFDPQMQNLVITYVNTIALAIRNARLYEKVAEQAIKDELTGLYNHRYLTERLEEESQRAIRFQHPLSLLMFDLDDFKLFNDTYGHIAGNEVLAQVGSLLKKGIRGMDIPVRFGGEEFVVVLPETDTNTATMVADRIQQAMRDNPYISDNGEKIYLTFSAGAATIPYHAQTPAELLSKADEMLYKAKTKKDCIEAYGPIKRKEML